MKKSKVRLGLRKKLFIFVFLAFGLLLLLTILQIRYQAGLASADAVSRSLSQSETILDTKLDSRYYSIEEVATSIARDGRVLPLVFEKASLTLQDLSLEFEKALEFDVMFFIDADGVVLARSDRPEAVGRSVRGQSALFDDALAGKTVRSIFVSQGRLMQLVVKPIFDNVAQDLVRGLVAVGYELSSEMAREINKLTASEVGFYIFSRDKNRNIEGLNSIYNTSKELQALVSQELNDTPDFWKELRRASESVSDAKISIADEAYYKASRVLKSYTDTPLGLVVAFRSEKELREPFIAIENRVLWVGAICFIFVLILAYVLAVRMSRPILRLVDITDGIRDGVYPEPVAKHGKTPADEIELLHDSVLFMGNSIREKHELENYLAGIASSLEQTSANQSLGKGGGSEKDIADLSIYDDKLDDESIPKTPKQSRRAIDAIAPGKLVDERYYLEKLIGVGSLGKVFLADDRDLDDQIAIKIMDKQRVEYQGQGDFLKEIKLARKITHRNITRTYDFGTFGGRFYYITMEYMNGYSLDSLISVQGPLKVYLGLVLVKQMCSALDAAHQQGIIHRDLKPQNISINTSGVLKIMDFGLAMAIKNVQGKSAEEAHEFAAGTPRFMAPEQFFGDELDARTDVYAMGILMFYIFTGEYAYDESDFEKIAYMHAESDIPRISSFDKTIPVELDNIVFKCMQKAPDNRYRSVAAIMDDLNKIQVS